MLSGIILAVYYAQLLHAITCPFQDNFQILYIVAEIFKYFALFLPFFAEFQVIFHIFACTSLLSRIGPDNITFPLLITY